MVVVCMRVMYLPLVTWANNGLSHMRDDIKFHSRPQSLRFFWPAAGIESSGSNHFETTKEITECCPSGLTQSASMAHAWNACSQSSRFLPQARRIVGSGNENDVIHLIPIFFAPVFENGRMAGVRQSPSHHIYFNIFAKGKDNWFISATAHFGEEAGTL